MDASVVAGLLGLASTDPRIEEVLQAFGVVRRPASGRDAKGEDGVDSTSQDWVGNLSFGIEFGFWDGGPLVGQGEPGHGVCPPILQEVYFYGRRSGVREYPHALPFGLELGDGREAVRRKLATLEDTRRSYVRDTWEHAAFRVTVSYADSYDRIDFVLCMLRATTSEAPDEGMHPLPALDDLLALLGRPADDARVQRTLAPLRLGREGSRGRSEGMDFRRTFGLRLGLRRFTPRDARQEMVVREIEYLRGGELDVRRWKGQLPFGIEFDDSPEALLQKVGHEPTHRDDQDFSGQAYWELPSYALLVVYSTMANFVLRVCTLLPAT